MKKALLVFLCAAAIGTAKAQVQFGIKAGANIANLVGDDAEEAKMKIGVNAGAFARLSIAESFKIQPEILFSTQGAKSKETFEGETFETKMNLSYINVPVMFQYHTASGFFAETGPQLGILASAKLKGEGESVDIKENLKSIDFSWGLGVGYEFAQGFGVNGRYNFGLSNLPEEGDGKLRNGVIQVGVFYVFGK